MFEILNQSMRDFKASYKQYFIFELLFFLLGSFIFVPLISFLFNQILKNIGTSTLLNAEVYKIGLTYPGIIGMSLIGFIATVILLIELGVLIIIAQKQHFQKEVFISEAISTAITKIPKLFELGIFMLVPIVLLIIPFLDTSAIPSLIDFNVPIFLTVEFYDLRFMVFLYIFIFALIIYLLIRCIFTLHFLFIEDTSIWQAMKRSFRLTRKNKVRILFNLFMLNLVVYGIGFVLLTFIPYLADVVEINTVTTVIEEYFLTFSGYMTAIFTLLILPVNILIITRLFYALGTTEEPEDRMVIIENRQMKIIERRFLRFFSKRKYTLASVLVLYLSVLFVINYTVNDNVVYLPWNVSVASHRGDLINAPENSMSSIRSALDKGVDAIEVDVMMTKDGVVVLNHDVDLQRTAGVPLKVEDMTYEELVAIDIGYLHSGQFMGERIPTLSQVLEEVREQGVNLIVDIKPTDESVDLVGKTVGLIEGYGMAESTYIQSFDYKLLQEVRKRNADIKIGQIMYLVAGNLSNLDVDFYTVRQTMLTERFVQQAKAEDREIWVWTVNLERNMREVLKYNIDGIITDYPARAKRIIGIDFAQ